LLPIALYYGDVTQVALVAISAILAVVSISAYRRRPEGRYLLLMLAFAFLCIASVSTALLEIFAGAGPATVQLVEVYLNPTVELLMAVSFLVAVLWSSKARRRVTLAFLAAVITIGLVASTFYLASSPSIVNVGAQSLLPAGCTRPVGGFLIVASSLGYNDSIAHGAPVRSWPVLDVTKGTDVSITVCNTYSQAVGFQVTHYLTDKTETVSPGQVINVNFLANQTGTFNIYCAIFNPIHIYLQGGELNVL
jgi:hypothetical protein